MKENPRRSPEHYAVGKFSNPKRIFFFQSPQRAVLDLGDKMIRVKVDNASALAALQRINAGTIRSRLTGAVQQTLQDARAEGSRRVQARFVRDFATDKMKVRVRGLRGSLSVSDRRHSLTKFIVNPSTRPPHNPSGGLKVTVRRGEVETLPHAFIGRGQVFERIGRARKPIKRWTGPSGANELGSKHIAPQIEARIGQHIQQEIERAIML